MASISSTSNNVDTFLSDLSELSQKKLREDMQRQRDLQRNIDDLRSRSNSSSPVKGVSYRSSMNESYYTPRKLDEIPSLNFNRSNRSRNLKHELVDNEEQAPPMPKRPGVEDEKPPPMPKGPINSSEYGIIRHNSTRLTQEKEEAPPSLPRRKFNSNTPIEDDKPSIPAKKERSIVAPIIPEKSQNLSIKYSKGLVSNSEVLIPGVKPNLSSIYNDSKSNRSGQCKSFFEMEKDIKAGYRPNFKYSNDVNATPTKINRVQPPSIKPKPKEFTESENHQNSGIKPNTPSKSTDWIESLSKSKPQSNNSISIVPKPSYLSALSAAQNAKAVSPPKSKATSSNFRNIFEDNKINGVANTLKFESQKPISNDKAFSSSDFSNSLNSKPAPPKPSKPSKELTRKGFSDSDRADNASLKGNVDWDLLKTTISNLNSVNKAKPSIPSKSRLSKYEATDSEELHSQLKKLGSVKVQSIENSKSATMAEGLTALNKLRPVPRPNSTEKPLKPEAIKSLEKLKSAKPSKPLAKPAVAASSTSLQSEKNDSIKEMPVSEPSIIRPAFHEELSSLLKPASSRQPATSQVQPKAIVKEPVSSSTSSSNQKLTHPNKRRSKGPKRRLPKTMKTSLSDSNSSVNLTSKNTPVEQENESIKLQKGVKINNKAKIPPPINKLSKPITLPEMKPSRNFSGEIFI